MPDYSIDIHELIQKLNRDPYSLVDNKENLTLALTQLAIAERIEDIITELKHLRLLAFPMKKS